MIFLEWEPNEEHPFWAMPVSKSDFHSGSKEKSSARRAVEAIARNQTRRLTTCLVFGVLFGLTSLNRAFATRHVV